MDICLSSTFTAVQHRECASKQEAAAAHGCQRMPSFDCGTIGSAAELLFHPKVEIIYAADWKTELHTLKYIVLCPVSRPPSANKGEWLKYCK